jgi:hypothetical protein
VATIYVSYKSDDEQFVSEVVSRLEREHDVFIDYKMPLGAEWRSYMLEKLKTSEIFLIFVSKGTATSDCQNAEIGSARFCSSFVDQKLIMSRNY